MDWLNLPISLFVTCLGLIGVVLISWCVPYLLSKVISFFLKVDVTIHGIQYWGPKLKHVEVRLRDHDILIDVIGVTSSLFHIDAERLISVVVEGMDINQRKLSSSVRPKTSEPKIEKLFTVLNSLVQFMNLCIRGITIKTFRENMFVCIEVKNFNINGSILHNMEIFLNGAVNKINASIFSSFSGTTAPLFTIESDISVNLLIGSSKILESVALTVQSPCVILSDKLFSEYQAFNSGLLKGSDNKMVMNHGSNSQAVMTKFLPKQFSFTTRNVDISVQKSSEEGRCQATLDSFEVNVKDVKTDLTGTSLIIGHGHFQMDDLTLLCNSAQILELNILTGTFKKDKYLRQCNLVARRLIALYHHHHIRQWMTLVSRLMRKEKEPSAQENHTLFHLELLLEIVDASVTCYMDNSVPLRLGTIQAKYFMKKYCEGYTWTTVQDLETKTFWVSLNNGSASHPTDKDQHIWGTILSMGVLILKVEPKKLDILVDRLQVELTPKLGVAILKIKNFVESLRNEMGVARRNSGLPDLLPTRSVVLACANTNVFIVSSKEVGFVFRIDSWAAERLNEKFVCTIENCKASNLQPSKSYVCLPSAEIVSCCLSVEKMSYQSKLPLVTVEFNGPLYGHWTTSTHLTIVRIFEDAKQFKTLWSNGSSAPPTLASAQRKTVEVSLENLKLSCVLSKENILDIIAGSSQLTISKNKMRINVSAGELVFDDQRILTVRELSFVRTDRDEQLNVEREGCERLQLQSNKATVVDIGTFRLYFPHGYNFADSFSEHLMGVSKWLRKAHRSNRTQPSVAESPLPRDLRIKVGCFSMELADDPFEVMLRANYELLEDEYKESLKRKKALDGKIEELKKAGQCLAPAKIEELYRNLSQKTAEIYILRHRQMYGTTPPSVALFQWLVKDVEIFAMADPSMHGKERAISAIRKIDSDSPWPDDGIEFNTLWCREVRFGCSSWRYQLRDFPQPLVDIKKLTIIGRLAGAEMEAAPRAKRTYKVHIEEPWESDMVERSLCGLKYYHDFNCLFEYFSLAYGPCWEPVIAQCNLAIERVNRPSKDPSPSLPFWDKSRLLFHGRITSSIRQMTILLHTSLDPYNTTEEMEVTWVDLLMDWTNCNFLFKGDFNIFVRTASKYDDCRLLQMPNLKMTIALQWLCLGDPNDHHSVMPCAPDKVPEYSMNQDHDSYRAFRSQNVIMVVSMETKMKSRQPDLRPITLLYGSTLKWFENLKYILTGVSRPIRRGRIFNNLRKRKPNLSRHYKSIRLSLSLHRYDICYWMSYSMQRGVELRCGALTLSSEHNLLLVSCEDGLRRRPRAEWFISYMNCDLNDCEVYLQAALKDEEDPPLKIVVNKPIEKQYFLSVSRVSYGREVSVSSAVSYISGVGRNLPTHRLVVHDMKSAWTKSNREMVFALYDSLIKAKMLKENLSPDVLNVFRTESNPSPLKPRGRNMDPSHGLGSPIPATTIGASITTPSPITRLQSGHAAGMLKKLIAEADSSSVVFSEDPVADANEPALQGIAACQTDDVLHNNWLIEFVNSQVLLKGCETKGYLILSAAIAQLLNRVHEPVWKDQTLVSKTSWICNLEGLQYYATVSAGSKDDLETIMWLGVEHIGEKEVSHILDMVGSGQSVGGVVSETVGPSNDPDNTPIQLQRIVSRCKCDIFYVCYGDDNLDPAMLEDCYIPPPPLDDLSDIWTKRERAVDSLTLTHHDLNICTNSLQYAMVLDVINNLILYVEPHRKALMEKRQKIRFQLQLSNIEDQKKPIQQLQNQLSLLLSQLRRLEKESFFVNKALLENQADEKLVKEIEALEKKESECKEIVNNVNEELAMLISCVQEAQLSANQKRVSRQSGGFVSLVRTQEICFKHAQWRLTETDGQLGIADLVLSNFLYTNNSKSDDSVEHTIELGYISVTNLLPNQVYREVLFPTDLNRKMPFDRQKALRVFSRDRAPVGGIHIKEHFEINIEPMTIALTRQFLMKMMLFCFPEKSRSADDEEVGSSQKTSKSGSSSHLAGKSGSSSSKSHATPGKKGSSFYVPMESDVEKMKQRAEQNMVFTYIKIPQVPVKVSYKGLKEKNIIDIHEFSLLIPTIEYHNVTWTWLDFLISVRNTTKSELVHQVLKQKLRVRRRTTAEEEQKLQQEEDKARLLFGSQLVPGDSKSGKRGIFKSSKPK